jgi:uncharacterized membrane protein YhhN
VLGDAASRATAWGAAIFMLSDAVLGVDRFVQPVPLAPLWVLGSYFVAQILMVLNARPAMRVTRATHAFTAVHAIPAVHVIPSSTGDPCTPGFPLPRE